MKNKKAITKIKNEDLVRYLKPHYKEKLYNKLHDVYTGNTLSNDQIKKLSDLIIENTCETYVKEERKASIYNYFNNNIERRVESFKDEERLLLTYVFNFGITKDIYVYFYDKYKYILDEEESFNKEEYDAFFKNVFVDFKGPNINMEYIIKDYLSKTKIRKKKEIHLAIEEVKKGNYENIDNIKEYYKYVVRLVFDNLKDKVVVCNDELMQDLTIKYDDFMNAALNKIKKGDHLYISRYINTRLNAYVKKNKKYHNVVYVDLEEKEKNIKKNIKYIDKYTNKYKESCQEALLRKRLTNSYYSLCEQYYKKSRKTSFCIYVSNGIRNDAKTFSATYVDLGGTKKNNK